jgi:hypothetical protein
MFTNEIDVLKTCVVEWELYTTDKLNKDAPNNLSSLCKNNHYLSMTKTPMVYDIHVEPHCPDRIIRQFGLK